MEMPAQNHKHHKHHPRYLLMVSFDRHLRWTSIQEPSLLIRPSHHLCRILQTNSLVLQKSDPRTLNAMPTVSPYLLRTKTSSKLNFPSILQ